MRREIIWFPLDIDRRKVNGVMSHPRTVRNQSRHCGATSLKPTQNLFAVLCNENLVLGSLHEVHAPNEVDGEQAVSCTSCVCIKIPVNGCCVRMDVRKQKRAMSGQYT